MGAIRWLGGHLGYLAMVIRKIFSFREIQFDIEIAGKAVRKKWLLVIVNNSTRTGGGFLVSPKATLTDGLLDVVLCEPLPLRKRLRYLPVIEKGKHLSLPFIQYRQEKQIRITAADEVYAQMDGELIRAKTFEIETVPAALTVRY